MVWEPGYFVPGKTDTVTESVRLTFRWLMRLKTSEHQAPCPSERGPVVLAEVVPVAAVVGLVAVQSQSRFLYHLPCVAALASEYFHF